MCSGRALEVLGHTIEVGIGVAEPVEGPDGDRGVEAALEVSLGELEGVCAQCGAKGEKGGGAEAGLYRPSGGKWMIRDISRFYLGDPTDWPIPADYRGNGSWAAAVFRPCAGLWAIRDLTRVSFGNCFDSPVPADYSGEGTTDIAVFRDSAGLWAIRNLTRAYFGSTGDIAVSR